MCKEDYCSYEQSKKLKELGFDWLSNRYYSKEDCADGQVWEYSCHPPQNYSDSPRRFTAPTLAQTQKWLREVKKITILIDILSNKKQFYWKLYDNDLHFNGASNTNYNTYEQALSAGIDKALELLK